MAYTIVQARKLLTIAELPVFEASQAQALRALTPARLRGKVARARTLRDKYRDLYRRQSVATRSAPARSRSPVGGDNERTQHKADLFAQVLVRFEERLQQLDRQAERGSAAQARAKAATATKAAKPAVPLKAAVAKALQRKTPAAVPGPTRSAKAPAQPAPAVATATAPVDIAAGTQRSNPLRQRSDNLAIHAHSKSQGRRAQGQRDAR